MDASKFKTSSGHKPATTSAKATKPVGKAVVADVDGNTITLNKGENAGFKKGQTVTISRKGKIIKDPTTGKILKIKYKTVGKIKLTEVEKTYSEGIVSSGSGFKVGDIIR